MTSFTERFSRSILIIAATGYTLVAGLLSCLALERLARWVEVYQGDYLWREQEYMQILVPDLYVGKGPGRLLLCGSSEAREAFLPDRFGRHLPSLRAYQNSSAHSGLPDLLVMLRYKERVYGTQALPEAMVVGITTRYISNIQSIPMSLLFDGINRFSPHFRIKTNGGQPELIRKTFAESLVSRARLTRMLTFRYRPALYGLMRALLVSLRPELAHDFHLRIGLTPSRFHHRTPWKPEERRTYLEEGNWRSVHGWDVARDRDRIHRDLAELVDFAARRGIALYVVNLPELSGNRALYQTGVYEAYLREVDKALSRTPFLDLRGFLPDENFYDATHLTLAGSVKVTDRVAQFIAADRAEAR